jgi:hypothetical protein
VTKTKLQAELTLKVKRPRWKRFFDGSWQLVHTIQESFKTQWKATKIKVKDNPGKSRYSNAAFHLLELLPFRLKQF